MHTVRLGLYTTKHDCQILEKRFHAICHIHNVMVKHARALLIRLKYDKEFQCLKSEYSELIKKQNSINRGYLSKEESSRKKYLSRQMTDILIKEGLSEYGFHSYIKVCGRQFRKCLAGQQIQKEATRVWRGTEEVIFGNGAGIHFKKYTDIRTISGKSNSNGAIFSKDTMSVKWKGLSFKCRLPKDTSYIEEALESDISYCEIERKMFPNGWHYYVIIYFKGEAPRKKKNIGDRDNITGIDIGTSTMAAVSDNAASLKELAPRCRDYNRRIEKLSVRMDNSIRMMNPNKYNPDGTIDKANHDDWKFSKTYIKNQRKLRSLYRQKSAYIKQSHEEIINQLIEDSVTFIIEDMSFKGLQRRSKNTKRSDKTTAIMKKDGTVKQVCKYKRKKRFGRSLNNRAPASFISILTSKAVLYGGGVCMVKTKEFRASQYDHATDTYLRAPLRERGKFIDGYYVQRDLYSAFLLKNTNKALSKPDREKCINGFNRFIELHDELIEQMKQDNISMKQCFGF